jgi:DNA modification methylase
LFWFIYREKKTKMSIKVLNGDCLEVLDQLTEKSVDTCITSPPYYGLRNYEREGQIGLEETPEEYVEKMVEVFRKVRRVLKDEGTVWLNLGDSYASNHYTGARDSDTGWKHGELSQGHQARAGGAGGIYKEKDLMGIPWMVAFALRADGWYLRQDIIWHKVNPMPESVTDRCTKAHEYIFLLSKNAKYYYDHEAIKEDAVNKGKKSDGFKGRQGTADYHAKGGGVGSSEKIYNKKNKRSVWTVPTKPFKGAHFAVFPPDLIKPCVLAGCPEKVCVECDTPYEREMEDVDVEPKKNISIGDDRKEFDSNMGGGGTSLKGHSGYFKSDGTPVTTPKKDLGFKKQCQCETDETKSGTVLDPFGGAGTTGLVADRNGRNAILIELNDEYAEMARDRLYNDAPLFVDVE